MAVRGRLTRPDVARMLGVSVAQLRYAERNNRIKTPTRDPLSGWAVYTMSEVQDIAHKLGMPQDYREQVARERAENAPYLAAMGA